MKIAALKISAIAAILVAVVFFYLHHQKKASVATWQNAEAGHVAVIGPVAGPSESTLNSKESSAEPDLSSLSENGSSSRGGASSLGESTMPRPMSQANRKRVDALAEWGASMESRLKDFHDLAISEKPDPRWSPQAESSLRSSLTQHTLKSAGGLEIDDVRCTATLCVLSATGGQHTEDPKANWQNVMQDMMGDAWFRERFADTSTSMINDGKGMVYLTYLIRK